MIWTYLVMNLIYLLHLLSGLTIPALYPRVNPRAIPAKARGFADIRILSYYYYGRTKGYTRYGWDSVNIVERETEEIEVEWEKKDRGATTDGGNYPPG